MHMEVSSGMVVYKGSGDGIRFLLLTRKEGFLDFPKGHIESGEDEIESARRETMEETGLELVPDTGFRYRQEYWYRRGGENIKKKVTMFLAKAPQNSKVHVSFEHEGYRWLSFGEAMRELSFKNQKDMLRKALEYISDKNS